MDDRALMENLLLVTKGACSLYLNGTVESSTPDVFKTFNDSLNTTLEIQNSIYKTMEQNGWYKTTSVPTSKITKTENKFKN